MANAFDPYHRWLGIPLNERPADFYQLLGITRYESDADVIDTIGNQRAKYLRSLLAGPHGELAQKLLGELETAQRCLLNEVEKAAYDAALRERRGAGAPRPPEVIARQPHSPGVAPRPTVVSGRLPDSDSAAHSNNPAMDFAAEETTVRRKRAKRGQQTAFNPGLLVVGVLAAAIIIIAGIKLFPNSRSREVAARPAAPRAAAKTKAPSATRPAATLDNSKSDESKPAETESVVSNQAEPPTTDERASEESPDEPVGESTDDAEAAMPSDVAEESDLELPELPAVEPLDVSSPEVPEVETKPLTAVKETWTMPLLGQREEQLQGKVVRWVDRALDMEIALNVSTEIVRRANNMPARTLVMHPGPRNAAVLVWKSPIAGKVQIRGQIEDVDGGGGDGIAWKIQLTATGVTRTLAAGEIENSRMQKFSDAPSGQLVNIQVRRGDRISLVVLPKQNHGFDLTAVDWKIDGPRSITWDVTKDLLADPAKLNPFPDQNGNRDVWSACELPLDQVK